MRLLAAYLLAAALLLSQGSVSITSVEPPSAKPGETAVATGTGLVKANVEKLFLTDGKLDIEMKIVEQTEKSIKFTIPASAKPGRYGLMTLTGGLAPKYVEQPVKITIE